MTPFSPPSSLLLSGNVAPSFTLLQAEQGQLQGVNRSAPWGALSPEPQPLSLHRKTSHSPQPEDVSGAGLALTKALGQLAPCISGSPYLKGALRGASWLQAPHGSWRQGGRGTAAVGVQAPHTVSPRPLEEAAHWLLHRVPGSAAGCPSFLLT